MRRQASGSLKPLPKQARDILRLARCTNEDVEVCEAIWNYFLPEWIEVASLPDCERVPFDAAAWIVGELHRISESSSENETRDRLRKLHQQVLALSTEAPLSSDLRRNLKRSGWPIRRESPETAIARAQCRWFAGEYLTEQIMVGSVHVHLAKPQDSWFRMASVKSHGEWRGIGAQTAHKLTAACAAEAGVRITVNAIRHAHRKPSHRK